MIRDGLVEPVTFAPVGSRKGLRLIAVAMGSRAVAGTVRAKVADALSKGSSLAQTQEQLNPEIRKRWPDWDAPIWIDGAIERYHEDYLSDRGLRIPRGDGGRH